MLFTNYVLAIAWSVVMFGINTTSDISQILTVFRSVTDVSRGNFPILNIHEYVKKKTKNRRGAHDI